MSYRRVFIPGATYFFTVNLHDRRSKLLIKEIEALRQSFQIVKQRHPFQINSIVIMPDHLHTIMTLPNEEKNYSLRWSEIKKTFSRQLVTCESRTPSRQKKRERGIWQRRFWEHLIRDEVDYEHHTNYIHYNPVKHGYVVSPMSWPYSSVHRFVKEGLLLAIGL